MVVIRFGCWRLRNEKDDEVRKMVCLRGRFGHGWKLEEDGDGG